MITIAHLLSDRRKAVGEHLKTEGHYRDIHLVRVTAAVSGNKKLRNAALLDFPEKSEKMPELV